jgi:hypothetical protein
MRRAFRARPTWASLSVDTTSRSSLTRIADAGAPSAKHSASSSAVFPLPFAPRMQATPADGGSLNTLGVLPLKLLNARMDRPCGVKGAGRVA